MHNVLKLQFMRETNMSKGKSSCQTVKQYKSSFTSNNFLKDVLPHPPGDNIATYLP